MEHNHCVSKMVSKKRGGFFGPNFFWREREEKRGKRRKRRKINTKEREKNKKTICVQNFFSGQQKPLLPWKRKLTRFVLSSS